MKTNSVVYMRAVLRANPRGGTPPYVPDSPPARPAAAPAPRCPAPAARPLAPTAPSERARRRTASGGCGGIDAETPAPPRATTPRGTRGRRGARRSRPCTETQAVRRTGILWVVALTIVYMMKVLISGFFLQLIFLNFVERSQ